MTLKLYAVRIGAYDWERAVDFYESVLGLPIVFRDGDIGWAQADVGGVFLGIERMSRDDPEAAGFVGRFVGVSLQVEDIDAVYKTFSERGVVFTMPPEKQHWGGSLAHFQDPEGNTLTLLGGGS